MPYFEWVQSIQSFFWDENEVNKNLERVIVRYFILRDIFSNLFKQCSIAFYWMLHI